MNVRHHQTQLTKLIRVPVLEIKEIREKEGGLGNLPGGDSNGGGAGAMLGA